MAKMTLTTPDGLLTMETEQIDITSNLPQPDERWTHTDGNGHEHYWRDGYPTLVSEPIGEPYWCADCDEEHQDTQLVCAICREPVVPGVTFDIGRRYMPGPSSYYLDGQPITEAEFFERRERFLAANR